MCKSVWLLLLVILPVHAQELTGRKGNRPVKTFDLTAEILHEGSFQLQRSGPGFSNWTSLATFDTLPGPKGFSDSITNKQQFYRLIRFSEPSVITEQPVGSTNFYDQEVRLEATVTGSWPLRFQWFKDAEPITDATNSVYTFRAHTNRAGGYNLVVSNLWGIDLTPTVSVKAIHPVATSISGKKIQYAIKGAEGGFISSGSFETTFGQFGYSTASSNFNLVDQGQWQYGALTPNIGRAIWHQGFVYPSGTFIDMTFTNLTAGTYDLRVPNLNGRQFGEFKIAD